ncbi:DUF3152 domain-containing protein [Streptomyces olivochromogenes]|uniref:DUF3152 domain-containing protein n=1 Tax=Streptomyces olivochromogenes TaxID=1963 RepID=UPI001F1E6C95|nr:DUF3152 domain-containing protein [Streptomyces olivochromogenes]MCF3134730.1 DUF3152 domain-containing protein [Streptomyces olivochromogenes]
MGRHSRRGPAPKGDAADITAEPGKRGAEGSPQGAPQAVRLGHPGLEPGAGQGPAPLPGQRQPYEGHEAPGFGAARGPQQTRVPGAPRFADGTPAHGTPHLADGTPARGVPRFRNGAPAQGGPRPADGTPARGVPRLPDGTPARGVPRFPDGTPAHGTPRPPDGTPPQGTRRLPDGTPAHGTPRFPDGTPARGVPQARGGHPEQREAGGGWGAFKGRAGASPQGAAAGPGAALPRQRKGAAPGGPRQDYLDAFGEDDVFTPRSDDRFPLRSEAGTLREESYAPVGDPLAPETSADDDDAPPTGPAAQTKGTKGRAFTGIAAAAVTTVLAVIVAGQVADGHEGNDVQSRSAPDQARTDHDSASRGKDRTTPSAAPSVATLTYDQKMGKKYPLSATFKGSGKFDAVPGFDKAPGKGQKYTYRVDVEQGLGLDGELFAAAVQKTLNDGRSWAHKGARTFERVSSGKADFVITLASPATTATWCAKSGLDTAEGNVSCDSASTERVMINAYRWAQGSKTYGDKMHAYRQMLINHEVGHRLGYGHVTCDKDGELAPVMQQQTKFLDHDGIHCLPNPWPFPGS